MMPIVTQMTVSRLNDIAVLSKHRQTTFAMSSRLSYCANETYVKLGQIFKTDAFLKFILSLLHLFPKFILSRKVKNA